MPYEFLDRCDIHCQMALAVVLLACVSVAHADTSIINEYDANGNLVTGDGRYYAYHELR